jgi:kynurenine formamidase
LNDSTGFQPAVSILEESPVKNQIAGYASINYRLSPHPSHPTHPSSPGDPSRNAKQDDHIRDVSAALAYLDRRYSINNRYLVAGHSCGAFLAFQLQQESFGLKVPQPLCIIGIAGIYHIPAMLEAHQGVSAYVQFVEAAFGNDPSSWQTVSPAVAPPTAWQNAKLIAIAHSDDDELVEPNQADIMINHVRGFVDPKTVVTLVSVEGLHHDVWKKGDGLAKIILECLNLLNA